MRPECAPGGDVEVLRRYIGNCNLGERRQPAKNSLHLPLAPPPLLSYPITPPADPESDVDQNVSHEAAEPHKILRTATHVLATEAHALFHLSRLYATDPLCRDGFVRAVEAIAESQESGGKTIVIGVGKSGKIGDKLVASMNSLGLLTTFLNPIDALHGDLGIIRKNDVLLLITYSGKTPELLQLLPHLPVELPLIALTAHTSYQTSPLTRNRSSAILLPAPIPESEVASFGVAAPTTSTTVAIALGDALSLSVAERIHTGPNSSPRDVFKRNHPGGAIGQTNNASSNSSSTSMSSSSPVRKLRDIMTPWSEMLPIDAPASSASSTGASSPTSCSSRSDTSDADMIEWFPSPRRALKGVTVLDCLRLAVKSSNGWLQTSTGAVIPPKRLMACENVMAQVCDPQFGLVVEPSEVTRVNADAPVADVAKRLAARMMDDGMQDDEVIAVVDGGRLVGAVEIARIVEAAKDC